MQVGSKKGYQNGLQNDSVVQQYGTLGTLPRVTLGDPRGSRALPLDELEVTCRVRGRAEVVHKCLVGDRSGRCGRRRGVCPIWRRRGVGKEGFLPKEVI